MPSHFAKGTIKIKNADERLLPFMPNTDISNVRDIKTNQSLPEMISSIREKLDTSSRQSVVKVMYEEPTTANTEDYLPKRLLAQLFQSIFQANMPSMSN